MVGCGSENSTCYDVLAGFEWQLTAVCVNGTRTAYSSRVFVK